MHEEPKATAPSQAARTCSSESGSVIASTITTSNPAASAGLAMWSSSRGCRSAAGKSPREGSTLDGRYRTTRGFDTGVEPKSRRARIGDGGGGVRDETGGNEGIGGRGCEPRVPPDGTFTPALSAQTPKAAKRTFLPPSARRSKGERGAPLHRRGSLRIISRFPCSTKNS